MKKILIVLIAGILFTSLHVLTMSAFAKTDTNSPIIKYTVTRDDSDMDNQKMDLMVSPKATKNQLLALCRYLRGKYSDIQYVNILIYDTADVELKKELYGKHMLCQMVINKENGFDQTYLLVDRKTGKHITYKGPQ